MKISPQTFTDEDLELMAHILNRGNQCEVKQERDKVVIVEIKRKALVKKSIVE